MGVFFLTLNSVCKKTLISALHLQQKFTHPALAGLRVFDSSCALTFFCQTPSFFQAINMKEALQLNIV